jgi:hypothetical protein
MLWTTLHYLKVLVNYSHLDIMSSQNLINLNYEQEQKQKMNKNNFIGNRNVLQCLLHHFTRRKGRPYIGFTSETFMENGYARIKYNLVSNKVGKERGKTNFSLQHRVPRSWPVGTYMRSALECLGFLTSVARLWLSKHGREQVSGCWNFISSHF